MTAAMDPRDRAELDAYLRRLRQALRPLPAEERDDIARETESHFRERLAAAPGTTSVSEVAAALGPAEDYGRRFVEDYRIGAALASGSAVEMLRAAALLLGRGVWYFVGFLFFLILFSLIVALGAIAVLKLVFPQNVGLWISTDPGVFRLGFSNTVEPYLQEVLGYWIVPLALAAALALYRVTGSLLRRFLRSLRRRA